MTALHQVGRALAALLHPQGSLDPLQHCPQVSISAVSSITLALIIQMFILCFIVGM